MKPTKIEFSFDDAKLEAIQLFLRDKESTLSDELDHFMDALYKKYVPQQVREYIEKREAEAEQAAPAAKPSRRRKSPATETAVDGSSSEGRLTRPYEERLP